MSESTLKAKTKLDIIAARQHIVQWMSDYMKKSNQKVWILGVSGGVDSALASVLCAETGYPLLCVEMPIHQNPEHVSRAQKQINWLKENYHDVHSIELELTSTFDTIVKDFEKSTAQIPFALDESTDELALANTRSRLRMIGLYYYSNRIKGLVCGTGNKVEDFGIGFFSVGGDGQVDISPIADLMKSEVRAMAADLGVLDEIVNAVPSDGLWDDTRSDESQIGCSYPELEWGMEYVNNHPDGIHLDIDSNVELSIRQREILNIYIRRHVSNLHKMNPIPICSVADFRD